MVGFSLSYVLGESYFRGYMQSFDIKAVLRQATVNVRSVPRLSCRIGLRRKFSFGSSQIEAVE